MRISKCKGTRDLLPQGMDRFRRIEEVFRVCCLEGGYEEIRTPTLEYLHLFTSAGTLPPGMLGKVYSFLDWDGWSGERVVLRPEGTIPAARLYVESLQDRPLARLFYVENMFAFESSGEQARERWQCGAELIGASQTQGDVELMLLALKVLKKLGIDGVEVHLSHAGMIKALLAEIGLGAEEQIGAWEKVLEGDPRVLDDIRRKAPQWEKFLNLLFNLQGDSPGFVGNLKSLLPGPLPALEASLEDLARVARLLTALGCPYRIDIASGKGFEYYTGPIFQFYRQGRRLGGGGRYDELIHLVGGRGAPASGFALYADQIMDLLSPQDWRKPSAERVLVAAEVDSPEAVAACFEMADLLREAGYVAQMRLGGEGEDFRWALSLRSKGKISLFDLGDKASPQKLEAAPWEEVLRFISRRGGDG